MFNKNQKLAWTFSFLLILMTSVATGCSSNSNKDQPMSVLDQNKNGIRDYIEPEIVKIANGSEVDQLIMEQFARVVDGALDAVNDKKIIEKQGEKAFMATHCSRLLKGDEIKIREITAALNDTHEHSKVYFKITSAFINYLNKHIDEEPSIKDCDFDASKFVGKK